MTGLPTIEELAATRIRFFEALSRPASRARISRLFERGLQQAGELELTLGLHLAEA